MPARPGNITGLKDILPTVNQLLREVQIRIDSLAKTIPIHRIVAANGTLNFGSLPANQAVTRDLRVPGAKQTGAVSASPRLSLGNPHLVWSAQILSNDVVAVRLLNPTAAPVTPNVVTWSATVTQ